MFHCMKTLSLVEDILNSSGDSSWGSPFHWWHTLGCHALGTGKGVCRHRFRRHTSATAGRRLYYRSGAWICLVSTYGPADPPEADPIVKRTVNREQQTKAFCVLGMRGSEGGEQNRPSQQLERYTTHVWYSKQSCGHNTEDCRWVVIGNEPGETEAAGAQHDTGLNKQWTRWNDRIQQLNPCGSQRWGSRRKDEGCFSSSQPYEGPFEIHVSNSINDQSLSMNLFSMLLCDVSFYWYAVKMIFKNKVMSDITKRLIFELLKYLCV